MLEEERDEAEQDSGYEPAADDNLQKGDVRLPTNLDAESKSPLAWFSRLWRRSGWPNIPHKTNANAEIRVEPRRTGFRPRPWKPVTVRGIKLFVPGLL
jgi:hypothetical protein